MIGLAPAANLTRRPLALAAAAVVLAFIISILVFLWNCPPNCNAAPTPQITFYGLNAMSGIALVALGAWALLGSARTPWATFGAYLLAWGTQLALTNAASYTTDHATSLTLFWLGQLFLPLQALLLLLYTSQQAEPDSRMYHIARWSALVAAACMVVGLILAATIPSQVLTITPNPTGHQVKLGALDAVFQDSNTLGIALSLILLTRIAVATKTKTMRNLLFGLALAWAYSFTFNLVDQALQDGYWSHFDTNAWSSIPLAVAAAVAVVCLPIMWWRSSYSPIHAGILMLAGVLAIVDHQENMVGALFAPGLPRLVAAGWLAWSLPSFEPIDRNTVARMFPVGFSVLATVVALGIIEANALTFASSTKTLGPVLLTMEASLALASFAIIGLLGFAYAAKGLRTEMRLQRPSKGL
jgi:hypothetical protein